tara:strand:- start:392 stop:778 length:387 start_codon:yes stop_codon:yes gene_type:complete
MKGICPFCKNPSGNFHIMSNVSAYHCFDCAVDGTVTLSIPSTGRAAAIKQGVIALCGTSEEVEHITPRAKCAYLASTQIRDDMYYARQIVTRVLLGPSVDTPQARAKAKDTGLEVVDWPLVVPPSPDP